MASGVAGLSSALISPFAVPPTFGGGTTPEADSEGETGAPSISSQPAGIPTPAAKPIEALPAAAEEPKLVTLPGGNQGIFNPKRPDYLSYHAGSSSGGLQDMMNLFKNIYSGIRNPYNKIQPNNGQTNQIDNEPLSNYSDAPDTATPDVTVKPQQYLNPATGSYEYLMGNAPAYTVPPGSGFNSVSGMATTFGLQPNTIVNPDGTVDTKYFDPGDEGHGAFGYNTRDPNLQGASLPVDVLKQSIGDYTRDPRIWQQIKNGQYKVAVTNPDTGQAKIVNLVDAGPANWTGNAIDLTYATQKSLGFSGKNNANIQLIGPDGSTIPLRGYHPGTVSTKASSELATSAARAKITEDPMALEKAALDLHTGQLDDPAVIARAKDVYGYTGASAAPAATETETPEEAIIPEEETAAPEETATEYKKGGLVKKQAGGLISAQQGGQNALQQPEQSLASEPVGQPEPFVAHIQSMQEGGEIAKPGPYTTPLSVDQEKSFQAWVKDNKIPWKDESKADYDMRGFWKAQEAGDPRAVRGESGHFPDIWKTPYHKTFSNESIYATQFAPHWEGDKLVPTIWQPWFSKQEGGEVPGKGYGDKVPALLEPGEFVIKKAAVKQIGIDKLKELNHG